MDHLIQSQRHYLNKIDLIDKPLTTILALKECKKILQLSNIRIQMHYLWIKKGFDFNIIHGEYKLIHHGIFISNNRNRSQILPIIVSL